jgi:hypothetical protein
MLMIDGAEATVMMLAPPLALTKALTVTKRGQKETMRKRRKDVLLPLLDCASRAAQRVVPSVQ